MWCSTSQSVDRFLLKGEECRRASVTLRVKDAQSSTLGEAEVQVCAQLTARGVALTVCSDAMALAAQLLMDT